LDAIEKASHLDRYGIAVRSDTELRITVEPPAPPTCPRRSGRDSRIHSVQPWAPVSHHPPARCAPCRTYSLRSSSLPVLRCSSR